MLRRKPTAIERFVNEHFPQKGKMVYFDDNGPQETRSITDWQPKAHSLGNSDVFSFSFSEVAQEFLEISVASNGLQSFKMKQKWPARKTCLCFFFPYFSNVPLRLVRSIIQRGLQ